MKKIFYLFLMASTLLRCGPVAIEAPASIEGVYLNQSETAFSKAIDTIVIAPFNAKAATYTIEHKTGFWRISKGVLQPKQNKVQQAIGIFDDRHLQLQDQRKGLIYSFTSAGDALVVGGTRYKKIQ